MKITKNQLIKLIHIIHDAEIYSCQPECITGECKYCDFCAENEVCFYQLEESVEYLKKLDMIYAE
jgi:hypothetical protein